MAHAGSSRCRSGWAAHHCTSCGSVWIRCSAGPSGDIALALRSDVLSTSCSHRDEPMLTEGITLGAKTHAVSERAAVHKVLQKCRGGGHGRWRICRRRIGGGGGGSEGELSVPRSRGCLVVPRVHRARSRGRWSRLEVRFTDFNDVHGELRRRVSGVYGARRVRVRDWWREPPARRAGRIGSVGRAWTSWFTSGNVPDTNQRSVSSVGVYAAGSGRRTRARWARIPTGRTTKVPGEAGKCRTNSTPRGEALRARRKKSAAGASGRASRGRSGRAAAGDSNGGGSVGGRFGGRVERALDERGADPAIKKFINQIAEDTSAASLFARGSLRQLFRRLPVPALAQMFEQPRFSPPATNVANRARRPRALRRGGGEFRARSFHPRIGRRTASRSTSRPSCCY